MRRVGESMGREGALVLEEAAPELLCGGICAWLGGCRGLGMLG